MLFEEATALFQLVSGHDTGQQAAFALFREALYTQPVLQKKTGRYKQILTWAAVLTGIVATGIYLLQRRPAAAIIAAVTFDTIRTLPGQQRSVRLPDNSQVILNGDATLLVPSNYTVNRKLYFSGEAFFEVATDAAHPFSVSCRDVETKVLGTSFMIQAYAGIRQIKITLATGRIAVNNHGDVRQLLPDQQLIISPEKSTVLAVKADDYRRWLNGELYFYNQSLQDIALILQAHYNIRFLFNDNAPRQYLYTASFDRNVSLDKVLELLSYNRRLHFKHDGNTVWVNEAG